MHGLIDPFYEKCEPSVEPGHVWCDQPLYLPPSHGLKVTRVDPKDDRNLEYSVCGRTTEIFDHAPVHSLSMESSEGAVVAKTKRNRPVIVLGGSSASDFSARKRQARLAEIVMVLPIYGSDQYDEQMRKRISIYDFTNAFYLPADASFGFDEGFARLDHVQPVSEAHLTGHRGFKLAPEALDALHEWLMTFLTNTKPADSMIEDYRHMVIEDGASTQ
jgi:hypothetical protein